MPETNLDPTTNPDVQEALSLRFGNATVRLVPLRSGNFGIFGQDSQLWGILAREELSADILNRASHELLHRLSTAAAARFYGEPDDRQLTKDLKRERRVPNMTQPSIDDLAIDL